MFCTLMRAPNKIRFVLHIERGLVARMQLLDTVHEKIVETAALARENTDFAEEGDEEDLSDAHGNIDDSDDDDDDDDDGDGFYYDSKEYDEDGFAVYTSSEIGNEDDDGNGADGVDADADADAGAGVDVDGVVMDVVFEEYIQYMKENFGNEANRFLRAQSTLDMRAPHTWYPLARGRKRKIIIHRGPTNSGKTHHAVEALMAAESGVYCGQYS